MENNLVKVKKESPNTSLVSFLDENKKKFSKSINLDELKGQLMTLLNNNPKLKECEKASLVYSATSAIELGLSISNQLGETYLLPYGDKCQLQIGYKGFIQLAIKSGQYTRLNVTDVKEGEVLGVDRGTGEYKFDWTVDDVKRNQLKTVGYYAVFILKNSYTQCLYMTVEDIKKHGLKWSKTFSNGIWAKEFDKMAKKTVLKLLINRYGIKDAKISRAIEVDQASIDEDGSVEYVDSTINDNATFVNVGQTIEYITLEQKEKLSELVTDVRYPAISDEVTNFFKENSIDRVKITKEQATYLIEYINSQLETVL